MARLRDLGDAHVIGEAGAAVAVRAAVLIAETGSGLAWAGELRPYRPLALTPGRYVLRVRGEDHGALHVRSIYARQDYEVAAFMGEGPPDLALQRLALRGGSPGPARRPHFPRVAGAVEPTGLGQAITILRRPAVWLLTAPIRLLGRRRRVGMVAHGRR
jgi:hypothetical protein